MLFTVLNRLHASSFLRHAKAVFRDAPLVASLARLASAVHAALVLEAASQGEDWRSTHIQVTAWAGSWILQPHTSGGDIQQVLLPLLVAGGSMLQGETAILLASALPAEEQDRHKFGDLATRWRFSISACSGLSMFLICPPTGVRPVSASRVRRIVCQFADTAQHIARYFAALGAASDSRLSADKLVALASYYAAPLSTALTGWAQACCQVMHRVASSPAASAEQRQQVARAGAGIAGALLWLLPQLPQVVHALNGGSNGTGGGQAAPGGSSEPPVEEGCSCRACRLEEGHIRLDGSLLVRAALSGLIKPWSE